MKDDQTLKRLLNRPEAPPDLAQRIHQNLRRADGVRRPSSLRYLSGMAAALVLGLVVLNYFPGIPTVVVTASQDAHSGSRHDKGITIPVSRISMDLGIKDPLDEMTVRMTKKCRLGNQEAIHMQITGANQGEVHLFLHRPGSDEAWPTGNGRHDGMYWQVLTPRPDLEVLVLRSADMNPDNVVRLIRHMFYS